MSDNPHQENRGNKDATITNPKGAGELEPQPGTGKMIHSADAFLIGDTMSGGYGKGPDILHDCRLNDYQKY